MAVTNNLKQQVDLPVFEWLRFAPLNSSALTCLTTPRDGSSRYLYYFGSNVLYRYDTIGDTWQQLSTNVTPVTMLNAKYVKNQGYRGQVLSATSTTLQIPSTGAYPTGYEIEIVSGTGKGQRRTIASANPEVIHDAGVVTSVSQNALTDSTKRYRFNQWEGYGLRVIFNTGFSQYREVIYNSNDTLTVFDASYDARNFLMAPLSTLAPYAALNTTAGTQAHFAIVSQIINLNSPWDVTPDTTSKFRILSHGIWWISANSSSPFFNFYYYDILSDRFVQKLSPAGLFPASIGTDFALAPINNLVGTYFTGSITSLTSQSITDSTLNMTRGDFVGTEIEIISGSGIGQGRRIFANTTDTFTFGRAWDEMPTVGSKYAVTGEEAIYFAGNGRAQMVKYHPERSLWSTGTITDNGIAFNMVLQKPDLMQSHGVNTATRVTNAVLTINTTPAVAGTGYTVGDLLTLSGGTAGRVRVESINPANGAVLSVSLYSGGSGYSATTVATTPLTAGGTGCTIAITSVGVLGHITTAINHDFLLGDTVTFKGATEAAWNTTYTISGIQSLTVVEVPITATANAVAKYALATSLLVDETQNWIPNQFVGKLLGVQLLQSGLNGSITWRKIIGNSQTTISFVAGQSPFNGNSRYFIQEPEAFGKDQQFLPVSESSYGFVSSATTSSITDTSKNWLVNTWANNKVLFTSASGEFFENIITTSTTSSLNFGRVVAVGSGTNTLAYWDTNGSGSLTANGSAIFSTSGNGVAWSGTRFIAVGAGTNTLAWSNDGITWNGLGTTIFTTSGNGVAWNGVRFVVVGQGNTFGWSYDGVTWSANAAPFSTSGNGVAWNGIRWVLVGQGASSIYHAMETGSSFQGSSFVAVPSNPFTTAGRGICWAGTRFIAVGSGTNTIATSSADGTSFTGIGTSIFSTQGNAVAWNGNITVAVGQGTNTIAYSTDSGSTWTGIGTSIFSTSGNSIAWNGTYWIAGGAGTNTTAFSTDGINWTGNGATIITGTVNGIASTTPFKSMTPNIGYIPDSTTTYRILDTSGIATNTTTNNLILTDNSKKWKINQWAGKRVIITSGLGQTQESTISSNTATTFTVSAAGSNFDNTTTYTILGRPALGAGMTLEWNWSGSLDKGKLLISPRGGTSAGSIGSHTFDIYDLRTNEWKYGLFILGQGETLFTGTMYAYDGDRIYFQKDATGRIFYYDYVKNEIRPFATIPYGMSTAILSNRMEIIQTPDGLKYLYIMRHSSNEMWRTLIYY